jgi:transposase
VHITDKRVTTGRISRRKHDEAFKRELVERSLQPGASVAAIAQDNAINANLLCKQPANTCLTRPRTAA